MKYCKIVIILFLTMLICSASVLAEEKEAVVKEAMDSLLVDSGEGGVLKEDKKIKVVIEARLIKIQLNEEHEDGVDWEAIVSNYQRVDLAASPPEPEELEEKTQLSIGTVTNEDYVVLLEALEVVGQMRELINPTITAEVGHEAKIVWDTHMPGNGFELQLGIAPALGKNGLLTVSLDPNLRWLKEDGQPDEEGKEEVYSSLSDIAVGMKSDETVVIGGLMQEKEIKRASKFPLLGDLPLVGFAFRRQNKFVEITEYIIFLSPRIIGGEGGK